MKERTILVCALYLKKYGMSFLTAVKGFIALAQFSMPSQDQSCMDIKECQVHLWGQGILT